MKTLTLYQLIQHLTRIHDTTLGSGGFEVVIVEDDSEFALKKPTLDESGTVYLSRYKRPLRKL